MISELKQHDRTLPRGSVPEAVATAMIFVARNVDLAGRWVNLAPAPLPVRVGLLWSATTELMQEFSGRTAVITGGASGIGLAMAKRFGAAGMQLMLGDIEAAPLATAAESLRADGVTVETFEFDVRELDQVHALHDATADRFGDVHLLCNNAGVAGGGAVAASDDLDMWKWTIDINLWGVIYGCKVFLEPMIAHGEPAHVVNTASMAGLVSGPRMGAYNVSKYGVVALSETLTREMAMDGTSVGVSVLCPAFVATGIAESDRNLPSELRPSMQPTAEEAGMRDMVKAVVAGGIDPSVVADAVFDAVEADRFWILTHDETHAFVTERADEIVSGANPSTDLGLI